MNEQDLNKNDINNYDIEFVDPDDLIGFVSDSADEESNKAIQTPLSQPSEDELENEAPNLKFADSIKDVGNDYIKKRQEDTRGKLAVIYTICTFIIFLIIIIVAVIDGLVRHVSIVDNLNTLLPLVSGIFLGTLGFVLGYYFRKEDR